VPALDHTGMSTKKTPKPKAAPVKRAKASPHPAPQPAAKKARKAPKVADTPVTKAKKPAPRPVAKKARAPKAEKPKKVAAPVDEDADTEDAGHLCGLSVRAARCCDIYLSTFVASTAYMEAGFKAKSPAVAQAASSRLLSSVKARKYLAIKAKEVLARVEDEQDKLVLTATGVAYADVNELVEYQRGACRHCHGKFHRWQFTVGEWDRKMTEFAEKQEKVAEEGKPVKLKAPDAKGGVGYDFRKEPHPDCPECWGHGEGKQIIKDTRYLSPAAKAMYAGVEVTKEGIKVIAHSQERARDFLAKYRKLTEDTTVFKLDFDVPTLEAKFGAVMGASRDRMALMREERRALRANKPDA
jgi:phage terminase small subunit